MDEIHLPFTLLKALNCENHARIPVWIMRQAGRYLPEYRKLKQRHPNFLHLCKTPELACEITLQPVIRFDLDAAIIFSDILTIPDAMGLGLEFIPTVGPILHHPIHNEEDIDKLVIPVAEEKMDYVMQSIRLVKRELNGRLPLIGFSGSPWTLAVYMVEGKGHTDLYHCRKAAFKNPLAFHRLLEKLTLAVTNYLCTQIRAGADCVMIFDTWGGVLPYQLYLELSLHPTKKIITAIGSEFPDIPIIFFTKGVSPWLDHVTGCGCTCIGLDSSVDIAKAARVGKEKRTSIQGNLEPLVLFSDEQTLRLQIQRILKATACHRSGHIFNLGHGIHKDTDPFMVEVLIDEVHAFRYKEHH